MIVRLRYPSLFMIACLFVGMVGRSMSASPADAEMQLVKRVWPIFQEKCLACHGNDEKKIKGGLDMRRLETLLKGGKSGEPALTPGKANESPLYVAVTWLDKDLQMPPKENDRLSEQQVGVIRDWIAGGAVWPSEARIAELRQKSANSWDAAEGVTVPTSGGLSADWTNRLYKPENLWEYQPLHKPSPPQMAGGVHPVDAFLEAAAPHNNWHPAPLADRRTLLRRATFDLLGLPPTPEEMDAFLHDPAPEAQAFAKVVERLLASPHYGEHWAQHWLDVVRYADSAGLANDFARGSAWRYRDYVVRAFNDNKPYDQFVREQLAGDEIDPHNPELLVATGFLRMGPWELTAMEVSRVARQRFLDDITQSVGETFLAQAVQCARCHDHKFDPLPTRDYYALQAVFATTQVTERAAPFLVTESQADFAEERYLDERAQRYREVLRRLNEKSIAAARAWFAEKKLDSAAFEEELRQVHEHPPKGIMEPGYAEVRAAMLKRGVPEDQIPPRQASFSTADFGMDRVARKGLERLQWDRDRYHPYALAVYDGLTPAFKTLNAPFRLPPHPERLGEKEESRILLGGDPFSHGPAVQAAVLSAPGAVGHMAPPQPSLPQELSGRRRALAEWVTAPENPLTARVIANRIWLWHFGRALAGNPNNFGTTGRKPTHPALLDWLAATLVEKHWSIKELSRIIMSSEAYRRAAGEGDTSYAAFLPRRLTAEELRDAMLSVSGELNLALGGLPVCPEINREAALQPRQVMGTFAEAWQPSPKPEQRHRRSLYALKVRGLRDPFLEVLNAPNPDLSCEAREASTVTPQVFALFNSEASYQRALAFAQRLLRERRDPAEVIDRAFQLALGRPSTAEEKRQCVDHWQAMTERHRELHFEKPSVPHEVKREGLEENTGETFTYQEPLESAADFVPDLSPADVPAETRGLAEVCLVLLNANEFAYLY